jgi:Mn2+/Fe2+ NRAMP family transporter
LISSKIDKDFLFIVATNVGAVVTPFMLSYQTSATAKKGYHSVAGTRTGTLIGAIFSQIMVAIVFARVELSQKVANAAKLRTFEELQTLHHKLQADRGRLRRGVMEYAGLTQQARQVTTIASDSVKKLPTAPGISR